MNVIFNFPDNKVIYDGIIYNRSAKFKDTIDISKPKDNLIEIDGVSYYFTYLNGDKEGNKGGNSIILKLYESQSIDIDNLNYGDPDLVIKISKNKKNKFITKKEKRFLKEILALKECQKNSFQNIIKIYHEGVCKFRNIKDNGYDEYSFYTMEYAKFDLKSYIEALHFNLNLEQKVNLCISLCQGLKELYSLGYYHRDIKPDNIFMIDGMWKIGDLGLIGERNNANAIDDIAERIGPIGWMSPESMNKLLCENKNFNYNHNCIIDHQSDIFQLGKVFWYIFQYNAPIGGIKEQDFLMKNSRIYSILKTMLNHSKNKRYSDIEEVVKLLKIIQDELLLKVA